LRQIRQLGNALDKHLDDPDVLVVNSPELVRRQAIPLGTGAKEAIAVLLVMVLLLATGLVPSVVARLVAACAMVLLQVLTVEQAYRAVNWTTVILVGAMMPLSTAMQNTGAVDLMATTLIQLIGNAGPYALLAGLFVLTAILGQLISNTATALIVIPIAVAAATEMGVSPRPVLMSIAVASAAAFLTPIATPVNFDGDGPRWIQFRRLLEARMCTVFVVAGDRHARNKSPLLEQWIRTRNRPPNSARQGVWTPCWTAKSSISKVLCFQHVLTKVWRMRVDTTVVETNVHYPTDSSLLGDY
jgi:hypothetical protein